MTRVIYTSTGSPLGALFLASTERGVCRLVLCQSRFQFEELLCVEFGAFVKESSQELASAVDQLGAYFGGKLREFNVPLDLTGTPFQLKVWLALSKIPYGQVRSYKEVASGIGASRAYRAVGAACASNPVPIIVPCHRVIASDGSLGGYSGGLRMKERLLLREGYAIARR